MGGAEGFQRAIADVRLFSLPFGRRRRRDIPARGKNRLRLTDQLLGRAHLARHSINVEKSKL